MHSAGSRDCSQRADAHVQLRSAESLRKAEPRAHVQDRWGHGPTPRPISLYPTHLTGLQSNKPHTCPSSRGCALCRRLPPRGRPHGSHQQLLPFASSNPRPLLDTHLHLLPSFCVSASASHPGAAPCVSYLNKAREKGRLLRVLLCREESPGSVCSPVSATTRLSAALASAERPAHPCDQVGSSIAISGEELWAALLLPSGCEWLMFSFRGPRVTCAAVGSSLTVALCQDNIKCEIR